jgi:hypothetical protein
MNFASLLKESSSHGKHDQREFNGYRACGAILTTSPAMPALIGIPDFHLFTLHVKHIDGTMLVARPAFFAFFSVNHRRHGFPPA